MYLCFCFYFEKAHFVMFNGLLVVLFVKLLYYITYFFKNWTHFAPKCFLLCVLRSLQFEKFKLCLILSLLDWSHA